MDKKNKILLILVLVFGLLVMVGFSFLVFYEKPIENDIIAEPIGSAEPDLDVNLPAETVKDQLDEINKTGFDSQTSYWTEKLKDVVDLQAELDRGKTIEDLCEEFFPEEYREYKEAMMLGDDSKPEYPEEETEFLYQSLLQMAQDFDFDGIILQVENLMDAYKFTLPYNYKIGDMYNDAVILSNLDNMTDAAKVKSISKLKSPVMTLIAAVSCTKREQCAMYTNTSSLCFKEGTRVTIQDMKTYTVPYSATSYDEKLMNQYFNMMGTDLTVTKITFTINYDLSDYSVVDFGDYFRKGNLGEKNQETETASYFDSGKPFEGMISPTEDEVDVEKEYDLEAYEKFKETVYEIYIPRYELRNDAYNRIYIIQQVSNLDMPYFYDVSHYKELYSGVQSFLEFISENKWSCIQQNENLKNEIAGQGSV